MRRPSHVACTRWALLLGILFSPALAGCRKDVALPLRGADVQIQEATDALVALRAEEPSLPGFAYGDQIAANSRLSKMPRSDADILLARLYYDLARSLEANPRATDRSAVRAALASKRTVGRFTPAYFDSLYSDTRARMATDQGYAKAIQSAGNANKPIWNNAWWSYKCLIDGMEWPITACRTLLLYGEWYSYEVY